MLPISLHTKRFPDGFAPDPDQPGVLAARSMKTVPLAVEALNLENPIALKFANCRGADDFVAFLDRFGDDSAMEIRQLTRMSKYMRDAIGLSLHSKMPSQLKPSRINSSLQHASLSPSLQYVDGELRLMIRASKVIDFMWMELATAVEVGAAQASCDHCDKLFLTGPLTGRRSHARYCSDRCRVAAMRQRNAAKGTR